MSNDVLQIAWQHRIPSFVLISGWDNLSSKGILFHKPPTIGVWGDQTKTHAIEIQGMSSENVFAIGAPHYEAFRLAPVRSKNEFRKSVGLSADKKVVLFGGSFRRFDETLFLRQIEGAIEAKAIPAMQVIYRPHPWRLKRQEDDFFEYEWKHVIMDPEIANTYKEAKTKGSYASSNTFLFSLEYLNELYRAIDAAISPMSTLILEAMIFGKPVLAVAFNDGKHLWSADQTSQMSHFRELSSLEGVAFCKTSEEFIPAVKKLIEASDDEEIKENLRRSSRFFVFQSDSSRYSERLCELVKERLSEVRR
jgi:CDP-glycerol glycerophosphotransferase (TagB/SpsB family)